MPSFLVILALILGAALLLAGIWGQAIGKTGHLQSLPPGARVLLMATGGVLILGGYNSAQALPRRAEVEPRIWIARATTAAVAQDTAPAVAFVATQAAPTPEAPDLAELPTPVEKSAAVPACVPAAPVTPPVATAAPAPKPARPRKVHIFDELGPGQWSEHLLLTLDGEPAGELSPGPDAPVAKLEVATSKPVSYRLRGTTTLANGSRLAVEGVGTLDPREGTRYAVRLDRGRLWLEAE